MRIKYVWQGVLILLFVLSASCHREEEQQLQNGALLSTKPIATYDTTFIRGIINSVDNIGTISLQYKVLALKVQYLTLDPAGVVVKASGLLIVPVVAGAYPLLSIQHGTIIKRSEVSSNDPMLNEGVIGLITASEGYVTCIPDYLGLGDSQEMHPYLIGDVLAGNVADMIRAVRSYMKNHELAETGELYLAGYSEGGYVTMATHRFLETERPLDDLPVTASAPMAGPYDLKTTVDTILSYKSYKSPAFIAYVLTAWNDIYQWNRLDEIFNEPYASMMPGLFDGTHTTHEINEQLPDSIADLIRPGFLESYLTGKDPELLEALQQNTLLGWGPRAPVRLFHGDADHTVPYRNAVVAKADMLSHGAADVTLVTIKGGTHGTSVVPAFTGALHWIDSLRKGF